MKLTTATVALVLAVISVRVGAMPAPEFNQPGFPPKEQGQASEDLTYHRGGLNGGRPAHGPMPDEDDQAHLERRHNYIQHPAANWKWWQKQGTNKMLVGSPDVRNIDVKNDPIGERLDWKRDTPIEEREENAAQRGEAVLRGKGAGHKGHEDWISVPVLKEH